MNEQTYRCRTKPFMGSIPVVKSSMRYGTSNAPVVFLFAKRANASWQMNLFKRVDRVYLIFVYIAQM